MGGDAHGWSMGGDAHGRSMGGDATAFADDLSIYGMSGVGDSIIPWMHGMRGGGGGLLRMCGMCGMCGMCCRMCFVRGGDCLPLVRGVLQGGVLGVCGRVCMCGNARHGPE